MVVAYFEPPRLEPILDMLTRLPQPLRPVTFSASEGSAEGLVSDAAAFDRFRADNPQGYFLDNDHVSIDVTPGQGEVVFWLDSSLEPEAKSVLLRLAELAPAFAFACDWNERMDRNRLKIELEAEDIEAWVGRDYQTALPGLYALTFISDELLDAHRVPLDAIAENALAVTRMDQGALVHLFEPMQAWQAHKESIDRLCERAEGIFAIRAVREEISGLDSYADVRAVLERHP